MRAGYPCRCFSGSLDCLISSVFGQAWCFCMLREWRSLSCRQIIEYGGLLLLVSSPHFYYRTPPPSSLLPFLLLSPVGYCSGVQLEGIDQRIHNARVRLLLGLCHASHDTTGSHCWSQFDHSSGAAWPNVAATEISKVSLLDWGNVGVCCFLIH